MPSQTQKKPKIAHETDLGAMYEGSIEGVLGWPLGGALKGEARAIFSSPPFPLNRRKRCGQWTQ